MTQHAKEPWEMPEHAYVHADGDGDNFSGGDWIVTPPLGESGPVAIFSSEANARRGVACVNACAGIPVESLESGVLRKAVEALRVLLSWAETQASPSDELWHAHRDIVRSVLSKLGNR